MPNKQEQTEQSNPHHLDTAAASKGAPRASGTLESKNGSTELPTASNPSEPIVSIRDCLACTVHGELERGN